MTLAACLLAEDAFARGGDRRSGKRRKKNKSGHITVKPASPSQDLQARVRARLAKMGAPVDHTWEMRQQIENQLDLLERERKIDREEALFIELTRRNVLAAGKNINAVDGDGRTLLHDAAALGYMEAVTFLLDHGAKVDVRDNSGLTARDLAQAIDDEEVVRLLERSPAAR